MYILHVYKGGWFMELWKPAHPQPQSANWNLRSYESPKPDVQTKRSETLACGFRVREKIDVSTPLEEVGSYLLFYSVMVAVASRMLTQTAESHLYSRHWFRCKSHLERKNGQIWNWLMFCQQRDIAQCRQEIKSASPCAKCIYKCKKPRPWSGSAHGKPS